MANDFDLQIKWLNGSQIEVQASDASAISGTEKVLVMDDGVAKEVTTQDIADLGGGAGAESITGENGVNVDNTDPLNPVVRLGGDWTQEEIKIGNVDGPSHSPYIYIRNGINKSIEVSSTNSDFSEYCSLILENDPISSRSRLISSGPLSNAIIELLSNAVVASLKINFDVTNVIEVQQLFTKINNITDYADDAAAAAGGIPVNGIYRTGSQLKIRVS